jgi:hypothetical protein
MQQFIAKAGRKINGLLCGFDRLVFRGELGALYIPGEGGMYQYLRSSKVLLKDFAEHVHQVSQRLKKASLAAALESGRVVRYVAPVGGQECCGPSIGGGTKNSAGAGWCVDERGTMSEF